MPGAPSAREDAFRVAAARSEHHVQIFRDFFWGWQKGSIGLVGRENVDVALSRGRGVVLWIAHFCFNSLATKKAFHEAGFRVSHLSRPEHGFSKSRFGVSWLNRMRVGTELRYLKDRILIDRSKPASAVRRGQKALAANEIISITAGAWEGGRVATIGVAGCDLDLATGAPGLALMTGAALLPVFCVREEGTTKIHVVVDAPIEPPAGAANHDEAMLAMTQEFGSRLAPYVAKYPRQWRDWEKIKPRAARPARDGPAPASR
jgi:hypothetical protein